jgi:NAD(P)-dependent dehydrogenase (short-subunit alcohol dehydrogenase family)
MDTRTIAITGAGSGMGAALAARLTAAGDRVLGVDVKNAEVEADLGTADGRAAAIERVGELSGGALDGLVTCAGLNGLPSRPASLLIAVNYFGTVEMLAGLRPLLAAGSEPAAVAISSNSTTCAPGIDESLVAACLAGDEEAAKAQAGDGESVSTYPVTKTALAWWVRRHAVTPEWAGAGITLNAVAPGAVHTPLLQEGLDDPTIGPLITAFQAPIGRNGRPEEIAALLEYLLGPDARFFCGSILFCDGGMDAQLRSDDGPKPWRP